MLSITVVLIDSQKQKSNIFFFIVIMFTVNERYQVNACSRKCILIRHNGQMIYDRVMKIQYYRS